MQILLTGGAGYIASHTAIELAKAGLEPVLVDNFFNSKMEAVDRIRQIAGKDIPFYQVDCCDKDALGKVFQANHFDAVIHFAGYKAVGESVQKPLAYYRNNLDSMLNVLDLMLEYHVGKVVFSSSATVYGSANTAPFTETMPTGGCTNPYGWTKYMIEKILMGVVTADPEWSVVLLRYFNPIGAHQSGLMGEDPKGIPNNLLPYVAQVAVGRRDAVHVFGDDYDTPDGTGVRDYIHVVDLAKGHVAACKYQHKGVEVFNLGTGIGYSVLDMVHAFEEANGIRIPYRIVARRPGDIATCYADCTKAAKVLGWKAEKTLVDMCRDGWRWQKQNPNGYDAN